MKGESLKEREESQVKAKEAISQIRMEVESISQDKSE
jgi:hypothetical protein